MKKHRNIPEEAIILIQEPDTERGDATPIEVSVPTMPKIGDGFRVKNGKLFEVSSICFRQGLGQVCDVIVFLSEIVADG
jgi:hypothetical protein